MISAEPFQAVPARVRPARTPDEVAFIAETLAALRSPDRALLVAGAGLMGLPFVLPFLIGSPRPVILFDTDPVRCAQIEPRLKACLLDCRRAGLTTLPDEGLRCRVRVVSTYEELRVISGEVGLCIEAITESLPEKCALFERLERLLPDDVSIATNTSGLNIDELARPFQPGAKTATDARRRSGIFLAAHGSNPPHLFPLIELARTEDTFSPVLEGWTEYLRQLGWHPVVLKAFSPGYILNALQFEAMNTACLLLDEGLANGPEEVDACFRFLAAGYWRQAGLAAADDIPVRDIPPGVSFRIVQRVQSCLSARAAWLTKRGVCSPDDVTAFMRYGLGVRWEALGLLRGADLGKIDLFADIHAKLMKDFGALRVSLRLRHMVAEGRFGVHPQRACTEGFYRWTPGDLERFQVCLKNSFAETRRRMNRPNTAPREPGLGSSL